MITKVVNFFTPSPTNQEKLITAQKVFAVVAIITGLFAATFKACVFARESFKNSLRAPYLGYALPCGLAAGLVIGTTLSTTAAAFDLTVNFATVFDGKKHQHFKESIETIFSISVSAILAACFFTVSNTFLIRRKIRVIVYV